MDVDRFHAVGRGAREDFYVSVSRLVPYKRMDLLLEAFRKLPTRRLVIVGDGPDRMRLARDLPANVTMTGRLDDAQTADVVGRARAFVFAAYEDFGIAPVEAQAAGTPVIAFGDGGLRETIRDLDSALPTGVLFDTQSADAIAAAIVRFEQASIDADACRVNAARFSAARFRVEFAAHFASLLAAAGRPPTAPAGIGTPCEAC